MPDITLGQAGLYAVLGYAVVFFGLILLMIVTILVGKFFIAAAKKKSPAPVENTPVVVAPTVPAPGSAGKLKLYNVDAKTAAMIMAIVADKLGKPINELRFISIKEVDQ